MTPERSSGKAPGEDDSLPRFDEAATREDLISALVALTAEVYLLRERLQTLESELARRKVMPAGAVERHKSTAAEEAARQKDLEAFVNRVLAQLSTRR
jgi:hypothetical protein